LTRHVFRALGTSLLAIMLVWNPAAPTATVQAKSHPVRKIAMGVSMLPYDDLAVPDKFTTSVGGHTPAIWSIWSSWGDDTAIFPDGTFLNTLKARPATRRSIASCRQSRRSCTSTSTCARWLANPSGD